jgi:hypothetical protein
VLTDTATPSATPDTPPDLILRYNPDYWVMFNNSRSTFALSGLTFERVRSNGLLTRYDSSLWLVERIGPGDCLMLWRIGIREVPPPDYCERSLAWFAVGQLRYFWTSDIPNTSFNVVRNGLNVATCPTNNGECGVRLRP